MSSDVSLNSSFCSDPGPSWFAYCTLCAWESEHSYAESISCERECSKCASEDLEVKHE